MDKRHLPEKLKNGARTEYAGWVFYKHVLRYKSPLDKNTIILSAHTNDFMTKTPSEEYDGLQLITKGQNTLDAVLEALKEISIILPDEPVKVD
jgi:hypothetical protein